VPHSAPGNGYARDHVDLLLSNYRRWLKRDLSPPFFAKESSSDAEALFTTDFALVSHGVETDPLFNYGNQTALRLFGLEWGSFVCLPSRKSAEMPDRREPARLLYAVYTQGLIDDYTGIRISASGRRFRIDKATVWNLVDQDGRYRGQASCFDAWVFYLISISVHAHTTV
tara:strand:- start:520 stop:1029 length:510 start_codon:yes stop_codon:yes gene_type:complete